MRTWKPKRQPDSPRKALIAPVAGAPWSPLMTQNGWFAKLSPSGRYVLYGFWQAFCADLVTGEEREFNPVPGKRTTPVGWYSDDTFLITVEGDWRKFDVNVFDWQPVANGSFGEAVFFSADGGHWGATLTVNPPRTIVDGVELRANGSPMYGIAVAGRHAVSAATASSYDIVHFTDGAEVRRFPTNNAWCINRDGDLGMGYYGPALLARAAATTIEDVTIAPDLRESMPVPVRSGGDLWIWSAMIERGAIVAGRRLGDDNPIVLENFPAVAVSVVDDVAHDQFIVAGNNTNGHLEVRWVPKTLPRRALVPVAAPFPASLAFGSFYAFSTRYNDDPMYPQNVTVVVTERDSQGVLIGLDHVRRAAAQLPIIIDTDEEMFRYVKAYGLQDRVYALYIGDTGGAAMADALARSAAERWKAHFGTVRPVVWYITEGDANASDFRIPASIDIVAPEFYFNEMALSDLSNARWRKLGYWMGKLGRSRPWIPIVQAYDRATFSAWGMKQIAALQPEFLDMLQTVDRRVGSLPPAIGVLFFAANRPGGANTYPRVRAWHAAMFSVLPTWTPKIDNRKPDPPPQDPPKPPPVVDKYPAAFPYEVHGMASETVGFIGPGGKFARIDRSEKGRGPFGGYPVHFDRDAIGEDETFLITPVDGNEFEIRHVVTNELLGADATQYGADITKEFYTSGGAVSTRGPYETWVGIRLRAGSTPLFMVEYKDDRGYCSASLAMVKP